MKSLYVLERFKINGELGPIYGPFHSKDDAVEWAHQRMPERKVVDPAECEVNPMPHHNVLHIVGLTDPGEAWAGRLFG